MFRAGVEGSPVTVVVDEKAATCPRISLHVRDLPITTTANRLRASDVEEERPKTEDRRRRKLLDVRYRSS